MNIREKDILLVWCCQWFLCWEVSQTVSLADLTKPWVTWPSPVWLDQALGDLTKPRGNLTKPCVTWPSSGWQPSPVWLDQDLDDLTKPWVTCRCQAALSVLENWNCRVCVCSTCLQTFEGEEGRRERGRHRDRESVGVLAHNRECCAHAYCLKSYLQLLQYAQVWNDLMFGFLALVVFAGALEYHEKSKATPGQVAQQQKITWLLSCRISIAVSEPDLWVSLSWSFALIGVPFSCQFAGVTVKQTWRGGWLTDCLMDSLTDWLIDYLYKILLIFFDSLWFDWFV